jgi:hypothetical protein
MSIESVSGSGAESVDDRDELRTGSLGSRTVVREKHDLRVAFSSFAARFCPPELVGMSRCTKIEFDAYGRDQYGNQVGVRITAYGEERGKEVESDYDGNLDVDRDHLPDSRDRDFDKDVNG